jgi:hypothetical protein
VCVCGGGGVVGVRARVGETELPCTVQFAIKWNICIVHYEYLTFSLSNVVQIYKDPLENCETEITTFEPIYNEIGIYDSSPIESDILWCQLTRHC